MKPIYLIRSYRNVPGLQISQPMGILYLASYLRHYLEIPVKLIDMRIGRLSCQDVVKQMADDPPSIVGISSLSFEASTVHELAASLKKVYPDIPIIAGGPYSTTSPNLVIQDSNIDYAVVGEGEITFKELTEALLGGDSQPEIPGSVFRRNGEVVTAPYRNFISDPDEIPMPAWDLLDIRQYYGKTNFNRVYAHPANMTIMTSRGCPFRCAYCHNVFGSKFRARSPENVLEEIRILYHQYGVREFLIIDDTFNLNRIRARTICDLILQENIKINISFPNGLKADIMDQELIQKLKQCGTYRICYGVEAASERILELICRRMDLHKTNEIITQTAQASILTHGFFMLGFPTETEEEMMTTVHFALKSSLHSASFFVVVPFPGTKLHQLASQAQDSGYVDGYYHHIDNVISAVPAEKVKKIVKTAYRKFYANPWRLFQILRLTPKNKEFIKSSIEFLARAK
ncbi:B12-binding domain-containing radical SAM protein [candidate division CSSED10-310 bacterium]|uniref:B12-binding domain-containing radical SAM protein n=1 Tax=candidate division CSSED10-310 bacterium TaxID=2855610 RepID=A0ABV6YUZ1_UNCC1